MKRILCTLIAAMMVSVVAYPQESQEIDELKARLAKLEKKNDKIEKIVNALPKISGYLQMGYESASGSNSFYTKRLRLSLAGNISSKVDYKLQIDFAGTPKIIDAYFRYKPFTELNFQFGEFKLPFSMESTDNTPNKMEFVDYPLPVRKLLNYADICGIAGSGRDMGLQVYGSLFELNGHKLLKYNLGLFNGNGINVKDNNHRKNVVGRLTIEPIKGFALAGSIMLGSYGADNFKRDRYSIGVAYNSSLLFAKGEYLVGRTAGLVADKTLGSYGYWATIGGKLGKKQSWIPALKFESFTYDKDDSDTRQNNLCAAITWIPVSIGNFQLRTMAYYTREMYTAKNKDDNNVVGI
ncbi:MAG: porin, partial [Candidatus Egerieousia sp.]|nr:porin [Candidatus Egerieousia sp.]